MYIGANLAFNIAALNLVRSVGNVITSLVRQWVAGGGRRQAVEMVQSRGGKLEGGMMPALKFAQTRAVQCAIDRSRYPLPHRHCRSWPASYQSQSGHSR